MRGSNFYDDVCIVPYRAEWPRRFRLTKQLIIALLLEDDIECYVRHVGGTAIPGMYRHIVWRCNAKFKGDKKCPSPVLREEQIKGMFMVAYDALTSSRTQIAADTRAMVAKLTDCTQIDGQITEAEQVLDEVSVLIRAAIHDHAQQAGDQSAFNKRYSELEARYTAAQERLAELNKQKEERLYRKRRISRFLDDLKREEPLDRWDDRLWQMLVEKAVVQENGSIDFVFFNGKVIPVEPKEWRH